MTKKIDQMIALLQELRQIIEGLDCGPVECHACVDTDDMAYIEVPLDGDGTAKGKAEWAFALEVLVGLAHTDWSQGELYTAFQAAMNNTNPFEGKLPDWEEVEAIMAEQARLRDTYFNLLYFLEHPDEYADFLRRVADTMHKKRHISQHRAREIVAAEIFDKLEEELELAQGEKATPEFAQMYEDYRKAGGDDFATWLANWIES